MGQYRPRQERPRLPQCCIAVFVGDDDWRILRHRHHHRRHKFSSSRGLDFPQFTPPSFPILSKSLSVWPTLIHPSLYQNLRIPYRLLAPASVITSLFLGLIFIGSYFTSNLIRFSLVIVIISLPFALPLPVFAIIFRMLIPGIKVYWGLGPANWLLTSRPLCQQSKMNDHITKFWGIVLSVGRVLRSWLAFWIGITATSQ